MAAGARVAAERPGLLVVVADPWMGATRFARELAEALAADGAETVHPRGAGDLAARLAAGLAAADLKSDPVKAAALAPFAALAGDLGPETAEAQAIGATLAGTRGLVIGCAPEIPVGAGYVELGPLGEDDAAALLADVAPRLDEPTAGRILAVAAGRPRVIVELGRANRGPLADDEPLRIPPPLRRELMEIVDAIDPGDLDLVRWAAAYGDAFEPAHLQRLTGRSLAGITPALDRLVAAVVLAEHRGPGPVTVGYADPLVAEAVRQATPPSDLRRRHSAVMSARRALGHDPEALVQHAIGAAEPADVVAVSLRAAAAARERNDPHAALRHAERAGRWTERRRPDHERLAALLELGLAQAGLGEWDDAASTLGDVIRRERRAGREGAALRAVTEWARIRWYAGYRREAAELIAAQAGESDTHLTERAYAFFQVAMFATHEGRHTEAVDWATRARNEALACGDRLLAIKALNAMALAEVFSSASPAGLAHLRAGFKEAREAGFTRQAAVTLNNETVCLLMLGMMRQAATRAQEGLDFAEANRLDEIAAPLLQNLSEALAAMGRLHEARRAAERSTAAYLELGPKNAAPTRALLAWLDFAEGKIADGLAAIRAVTEELDQDAPLDTIAPIAALHAHIARAAGQPDEAVAIVRGGLERREATEDRLDTMALLGAACEVLPARESKHHIAELRESADAGSPLATALVAYAEAYAARGRPQRAAAFRAASEAFAASDCVWWSARALMLAAEAEADGDTAAAVADLLEARRLFRQMEAPGWRAQCEAALRARGHRFVMASRHREDTLSGRELEVLDLVARGLTNREIAERLYISEKTVGRHLEHVYGKLGVGSRTAAITAAVDRGLITEVV